MRLDIQSLQKIELFAGIMEEDIPSVMRALEARAMAFDAGQPILPADGNEGWMGVVLAGTVQVTLLDYSGNSYMMSRASTGDIFAESFVCAGDGSVPVNVLAEETSEVLLIHFDTGFALREEPPLRQLTANMLGTLARKNLFLNNRLAIVMQRTTREKLLVYLRGEARRAGNTQFTIPLNRQQLADTLGVERSAMSAELSRMARDGLVAYERNRFTLL